jgi:Aldolase/RraA
MPKYEIAPMPAQLIPGRRVAGTALTLAIPGPDATPLHQALGLLRLGDILVVDRLGDDRHACWGGGVIVAAKAVGAKAGVIDGSLHGSGGNHRLELPRPVPPRPGSRTNRSIRMLAACSANRSPRAHCSEQPSGYRTTRASHSAHPP